VRGSAVALVTEVVDWLRPAFGSVGYLIVSVAMFVESAAFVGLFVPGDVILAVGGVYAAKGDLALPVVIACGIVFGLLGETTGYLLGRRYGDALLERLPLHRRFEQRVSAMREAIRRNGGKSIVIGRFATGVAGTVPFAAGVSDVDPKTFFVYTVPTVSVWAVGVVLLGYVVGNNVETIDRVLTTFGGVVLALVATAVAGTWAFRRFRQSRHNA
jgi:membrane protein DedA with SNARE-associated domain